MSKTDKKFVKICYKQLIDDTEEVFELKDCFVDLGIRVKSQLISDCEDNYQTSDEEYKYFDRKSDTESYDSEDNGFHNIVEHFNRIVNTLSDNSDDNLLISKTKTKMRPKRSKRLSKGKEKAIKETKTETKINRRPKQKSKEVAEPEPQSPQESQPLLKESEENPIKDVLEESLLEDDFYETNMELFLSQSITQMTQTSALIQQNGRFSYYPFIGSKDNDMKDESLKIKQNMDSILNSMICLTHETNCWPLLLKTMTEDLFAFRKSSKCGIYLVNKLLSHYDWSQEKSTMNSIELLHFQRLHNQFLVTFMREILLSCYSRPDVLEILGGTGVQYNSWSFVSKLITFLINESIKKSEEFSIAFIHLQLIVEILEKDFQIFLSESSDYCVDIHQNCRPVICRLIWSQKSPNYLNSVLKQLIFLLTKIIKIKNDSLLIEVLKLFELSAECLRIGSGNVRPFISFAFNKSTPITELFQQLSHESMANNEVFEKLMRMSNICWIKLQFCAYFMTKFIVDLKQKYMSEKQNHLSLKLIVECLTNARLLSKSTANPVMASTTTEINLKSSKTLTPMKKRPSVGLIGKTSAESRKEWFKKNKYGENGLHIACIKGQTERLKQLLQLSNDGFGPDPNETDNAGYTPLSEAAIHGYTDCIKALIEWKNTTYKVLDFELGPEKQTPLHECIEINSIESAKLIIESGGQKLLDIRRRIDGKTPKDLIKSDEMREMIDSSKDNTNANQYRPKISLKTTEDIKIFVQILIELIVSYVETTKIDAFVTESQHFWSNSFSNLFNREINDNDISLMIEDLTIFRKLPTVCENLKTLFTDSAVNLFNDLDLMVSILFPSD